MSTAKSKAHPKDTKPVALSRDLVESSGSESEGQSSSREESPDSDGDLETVTPKKRVDHVPAHGSKRGNTLPRYAPPAGMIPLSTDVTFKDSPFEYHRLADNPNLELWAIRAPAGLKPTRLSALSLKSNRSSRTPTGILKHKSTTYDLIPAGSPSVSHAVVDKEGRQPTAGVGAVDAMTMWQDSLHLEGGEEMSGGMRLLVPKVESGGVLVVSPLPISHHLILTPRTDAGQADRTGESQPIPSYLSASVPDSLPSKSTAMQGVTSGKRSQPTHLLKFRNRAFGYDTPGPTQSAKHGLTMDVDGLGNGELQPVSGKSKKRKSGVKASHGSQQEKGVET